MKMPDLPVLQFGPWRRWHFRERLLDPMGPGPGFDLAAVYALGHFSSSPPSGNATFLEPDVVYVGLSTRVTGRTGWHERAAQYRTEFQDPDTEFLYLTIAHPESKDRSWATTDVCGVNGAVQRAALHALERMLIYGYALEHGRIPKLNRV